MKPIEHVAKTPSANPGVFALLCSAFRGKGTGAPIASRRVILPVLATTLAALALTATPAHALKTHLLIEKLTGGETPAGSFEGPDGIAVVESGPEPGEAGDLYVADIGHQVVDKLGPTGAYLSQVTGAETPAKSFAFPTQKFSVTAAGLAVDNDPLSPSFGDLYVLDAGHGVIDRFSASGRYDGQLTGTCEKADEAAPCPASKLVPFNTGGAFGGPYGVAVDPGGNVWVYEANGNVDQFNAQGVFLKQFASACTEPLPSLAVDSIGDTYVNCGLGIEKFSSAGFLLAELPGRGQTAAVGVDQADNHVFEISNIVREFDATSAPVSEFVHPESSGPFISGAAVNGVTGDLYLAVGELEQAPRGYALYRFGPLLILPDVTTGEASAVAPEGATVSGAVNPDGIQVSSCEFEFGTTAGYGRTAPCAPQPGSGSTEVPVSAGLPGLKPDTTYHYRLVAGNASGADEGVDREFTTPGPAAVDGESSKEVGQTAARLLARINPHGFDTTYHFEYGTSASYGTSIPIPDADIGEGVKDVRVSAELSGLQAGVAYHFRVVAVSSQGTTRGLDQTFTTVAPALIGAVSATALASTSATLDAKVNPLNNETTCQFEYGTSSSYGLAEACEPQPGSGEGNVSVTRHLTGLHPGVIYHYRLLVRNALGTATSPDHTFVYSAANVELPDRRAYEMVTPPQKNGALVDDYFFGTSPSVSEAGIRVITLSDQCFAASESCTVYRGSNGEPFEFTRSPTGWVTTPLAPPATRFPESAAWEFSADEGTTLFSMPTGPSEGEEWYARNPDGSFPLIGPANPPGLAGFHGTRAVQATADLSHLVWEHLVEDLGGIPPWPFDKTEENTSLYEYVATANAHPFLVGVSGGLGSTDLISTCGTVLGSPHVEGWNTMSADGRTVFFTALAKRPSGVTEPCPGSGANKGVLVRGHQLYARVDGELPAAHTVAISQPQCGPGAGAAEQECRNSPPSDAAFLSASTDGSKAFFLDTQKLTDGATDGSGTATTGPESCAESENDCNLYLYDFARPSGQRLIDVSAGDTSAPGPRVQGVVATAADGSHVYFIARGVLSGRNAAGSEPTDGAENLYLYERDATHPEGRTSFVAGPLPAADVGGGGHRLVRSVEANVTPDGRFLVFSSHGDLTPDAHADGNAQIYRYDAASEQLVRVSVGDGGYNDNGNAGTGDATIVGADEETAHLGPPRGDPTMSNDGSYVFFQSPVALTPHALGDVLAGHNGELTVYAQNVYEYHEGHVYLISDGHDVSTAKSSCGFVRLGPPARNVEALESAVCLLGADASGHNVFFTTAGQLVPKDTDTQGDIYDARICEPENADPCVTEPAAAPPPCLGEQCHGIPAGIPGAPGVPTSSFSGAGNISPQPPPAGKPTALTNAQKLSKALAACRKAHKHSGKRRAACERAARKAYGAAHKAKKAGNHRRPGR